MSVRASSIAGNGVFADDPYATGAVVLTLADDGTGPLNHSCDPNLGWTQSRTLVALRDIAPGDELTVDYATAIDDAAFALACHCGTYRCRQLVEGTDWRIPQLQRRYAGHWAPHVQRLIGDAAR
ncbi:SET domain-containing protein [Jatrophihabitans endophyticus]|uniref:SET domain-containing protein n=1 Tax=Jatrophihabitans endophyticus TaxID=1206085 RepID=A0A1M5STH5_9ACTN|nr:SET domain-containing protein [Jatrophihabitans endophyticus]SHH41835.1 SET domain-containing protein [Jatrophihabitans endophyticus]